MTMTKDKIQYYAVYDEQLEGFCDSYGSDRQSVMDSWRDFWTEITETDEIEDIEYCYPEYNEEQVQEQLTKQLYNLTDEEFFDKTGFKIVQIDSGLRDEIKTYFEKNDVIRYSDVLKTYFAIYDNQKEGFTSYISKSKDQVLDNFHDLWGRICIDEQMENIVEGFYDYSRKKQEDIIQALIWDTDSETFIHEYGFDVIGISEALANQIEDYFEQPNCDIRYYTSMIK